MARKALYPILLFFIGFVNLNAQIPEVMGIEWIGKNWDYLLLERDSAKYDHGYGGGDYMLDWKEDTLILGQNWYSREKSGINQVAFRIKSFSSKSMTLIPTDKKSKRFLDGKNKFRFKNLSKITPKKFEFNTVKFLINIPFGENFLLEVDHLGELYVFRQKFQWPDEPEEISKKLLKGQLTQNQIFILENHAKNSLIWKHPEFIWGGTDPPPPVKITIEFNNRIYDVPEASRFALPAQKFVNFLIELPNLVSLKECQDEESKKQTMKTELDLFLKS